MIRSLRCVTMILLILVLGLTGACTQQPPTSPPTPTTTQPDDLAATDTPTLLMPTAPLTPTQTLTPTPMITPTITTPALTPTATLTTPLPAMTATEMVSPTPLATDPTPESLLSVPEPEPIVPDPTPTDIPLPEPPTLSLTTYTHPSGIFSFALPRDWQHTEQSLAGVIRVVFIAPDQQGVAIVTIADAEFAAETTLLESIGETYGAEPGFTMSDLESHPDGSTRVRFMYEMSDPPATMIGSAAARYDERYFSNIWVTILDSYVATPSDIATQMLDSYTIDHTVPLP